MLPSIYAAKSSSSLSDSSGSMNKKKNARLWTLISYACALLACLVTLVLFVGAFHSHFQHKEVVTFVRQHPKDTREALANSDVFISVKTTFKNHQSRLSDVIKTWYQLARDHTYFFTDKPDPTTGEKINAGHLIVTQCGSSHSRQDLCCKMSSEFDAFLESNKK